MAQSVARRQPNFLEILARNPHGWGPEGLASPEEGFPDPNATERGQNALAMFGPMAEAATPNLLQAAADPRGAARAEGVAMAEEVPYLMAGPVLGTAGRVARATPRLTAALGGLGLTAIPSKAGSKDKGKATEGGSAEVKKLQEKMRAAGLYSGPIDGRLDPDGPTMKAKKEYDKLEADREKRETERKKIEAGEKETQRLAEESARKSKERAEGTKRLKEMDENETWYGKAAREYGPWAGGAAGLLLGYKMRSGAARKFAAESQEAANKANSFIVGRGPVPPRAGGVNRFWQEGGGAAVPFTAAPKAKHAIKSNKAAASATTLYPPLSTRGKYLQLGDATKMAGIGAEMGASQIAANAAHDELRSAQKAVADDPSEANIQRLETARNIYAAAEGAAMLGRGALLGYGAVGIPTKTYKRTRPDVNRADAERTRVDAIINQTSRTPPNGVAIKKPQRQRGKNKKP